MFGLIRDIGELIWDLFASLLSEGIFPLLVVAVLVTVGVGIGYSIREESKAEAWAVAQGYDAADVDAFLSSVPWDFQDFKKSESVRLHYAKWKDGIVTEGLRQAQARENEDRARSSGLATGVAVGLAVSSASK